MDLFHKYHKLKGSFESCFCCILSILSELTFRFLELIVSIFGKEAVVVEALILINLQGQERQSLKTKLPPNLHQPPVEALLASPVAEGGLQEQSPSPLQPCDPNSSKPTSRSEIPIGRNCAASPVVFPARLKPPGAVVAGRCLPGSGTALMLGQHLPCH